MFLCRSWLTPQQMPLVKVTLASITYSHVENPFVILLTRFLMNLTCLCSVPNVDLPPLCSSRFRPGPPGEQAQAASQFIADVIERCDQHVTTVCVCSLPKYLSVFSLICDVCAPQLWGDQSRGLMRRQRKGSLRNMSTLVLIVLCDKSLIMIFLLLLQLCWVLYCDIMCLDYDGNILDACIIALLASLKNSMWFYINFTGGN